MNLSTNLFGHYKEMATIFAKGSNEPLATEAADNEGKDEEDNNVASPVAASMGGNGGSSSAARPSKRAKVTDSKDGLIGAIDRGCDKLAKAEGGCRYSIAT